jgi:hypothetical protein
MPIEAREPSAAEVEIEAIIDGCFAAAEEHCKTAHPICEELEARLRGEFARLIAERDAARVEAERLADVLSKTSYAECVEDFPWQKARR